MTIVVVSPATTGTGTTWAAYWRRLADELGFWQLAVTTAEASGGEASRVVIAGELRDDEEGFDFLGMPWVYAFSGAQAGTQRRIVADPEAGYIGEHGAFTLSRPFNAALATNDVLEFSSPLPIKRHLGRKGVADFCNDALARCWVEARITFTGDGTREIDLAAYTPSVIFDEWQLRGLYDTRVFGSTTEPYTLSPQGYRVVKNGAALSLVTDTIYATSETFQLAVIVRADRLVYDGASWALTTGTPGLQGDTWQAAAPEEWVLAIGMLKTLQYLTRLVLEDRSLSPEVRRARLGEIADRRLTWAQAAADVVLYEMPKSVPVGNEPMVGTEYATESLYEGVSTVPLVGA